MCKDVQNQSDHCSLFITLNCDVVRRDPSVLVNKPRKQWERANQAQLISYKALLDNVFLTIDVPYDCITCTNMQCTDVNHCASIQRLHDQIISASEVIPCPIKVSKNIPGWNKYVKDHLDTSLFWHFLWKQSSSRSGTVADIMRQTRARYHYAIRFVKKQ